MSKLILKPDLLLPNDFVNLHGHSTYSVGDAIGHADEIVASVIDNGMDAVAITDHGNMNVVADFYLHTKSKFWDRGRSFKPVFGNEFYFHPSLDEWKQHKKLHEERKKLTPEEIRERQAEIIANSLLGTVADLDPDDEDGGSGAVVENEEESKKSKDWSPIKRKHHLVLLAQNEVGLKNLFRLNGFAQAEGFYMKPRIDFAALERWNEGIVCTSACLAGIFNYELRKGTDLGLSDAQIMTVFENIADRFDQIFNKDKSAPPRFFLEIQFNKIPDQHRLNSFLVALHRKTGIPLTAAADYHYPRRELFRARDMIRWITQNKKFSIDVRDDISQLECELFPKNAQDMIEAYMAYDGNDYITTEELLTAIKNTRFIVDNLIEQFEIDQGPKLPKIVSGNPHSHLETMVVERFGQFYKMGKIPQDRLDEYMAQLKYELEIIRKKRFANYFITYEAICKQVKLEMLMGPGRGSGAGSLVNWLLDITELDPIKFDLMFERFLDEHRTQVYPRMDLL